MGWSWYFDHNYLSILIGLLIVIIFFLSRKKPQRNAGVSLSSSAFLYTLRLNSLFGSDRSQVRYCRHKAKFRDSVFRLTGVVTSNHSYTQASSARSYRTTSPSVKCSAISLFADSSESAL